MVPSDLNSYKRRKKFGHMNRYYGCGYTEMTRLKGSKMGCLPVKEKELKEVNPNGTLIFFPVPKPSEDFCCSCYSVCDILPRLSLHMNTLGHMGVMAKALSPSLTGVFPKENTPLKGFGEEVRLRILLRATSKFYWSEISQTKGRADDSI